MCTYYSPLRVKPARWQLFLKPRVSLDLCDTEAVWLHLRVLQIVKRIPAEKKYSGYAEATQDYKKPRMDTNDGNTNPDCMAINQVAQLRSYTFDKRGAGR